MILTVVGSGTLVPSSGRSTPALAIREDDLQVTVDGGSGTLRRQRELGLDYRATHTLFFTHVHPDHTLDLIHFLFAVSHAPGPKRTDPVRIIGPRGFASFVDHLRDGVRSWTAAETGGIEVRELEDGDRLDLGPLAATATLLDHSVTDIGYRFEDRRGRTAAFTGDTGWCDALLDLARDVDVLVCECSGDASHALEGHMSAPEAGRLARAAGARQLVLTHLYPLPDDRTRIGEAAREFAGPVHMAADGDSFVV